MAMGVPLALTLSAITADRKQSRKMLIRAVLFIAGGYFSMSRGPWLGIGLSLFGLAVLCGPLLRKRILFVTFLAAFVIVVRPGVRETIMNLYHATLDEDSAKGSSFNTRLELWPVAWAEIKKSPERVLLGYGPESTEGMDLSDYWFGKEGWSSSREKIGFTSWDSTYASYLIELGVVGLALAIVLLLRVVWTLFNRWRISGPEDRIVVGGILISCMVFLFALTNVAMYAPQLKYLFWMLAAIGGNYYGTATDDPVGVHAGTGRERVEEVVTSETLLPTGEIQSAVGHQSV
jgi:O-antigen ligase